MTAAHPRRAANTLQWPGGVNGRGAMRVIIGCGGSGASALHRLGGGPRRMEKAAAHDYDNTAKHRNARSL